MSKVKNTAEMKNNTALTTNDDATKNILAAAKEDAGFEKLLKFIDPDYTINKEVVPLGTEYFAHVTAWMKVWIKFVDGELVDRKLYRVAHGEKPPEREELDDTDKIGEKDDPWVLQHLVPFENMSTGEVVIFTTKSFGGRRAVSDLCSAYARRALAGQTGQPLIQLATGLMPSRKYGDVPCPKFKIVGWEGTAEATPAADNAS